MMFKRKILATLLIGIGSQFTVAQSFDKEKLDRYFDTLEAKNKFMGSVAVSAEGKTIYSKSIGFCDVKNKEKTSESSKYRIGSISKTFTTVLVLKAVEENKISLNQTIESYFPTVKNAEKITIQHLLSHRSGIHNFTNDEDYLKWSSKPKTEEEMVNIIANVGSDFEPDSKAEYSNSNFVLLSYILEQIYEKSFATILQENIIQPLELTNTYYGGKIDPSKNECYSYLFIKSWKAESETDMSVPMGAGGIVSTASDLTKFSDALFNGKLVSDESINLMKTIKDGYGIGLFRFPFNDNIGFGHTGGIDGFSSVFTYFSDGKISYALISNGANYNRNNVSIAVLNAIYGEPYEIPEFTNYEVTSKDLDQYLGVYASEEIPLKITVTKDKNTLIAQGTGQPALPLEAIQKHIFKFEQAAAVFIFNPAGKKMILKQGGGEFTFTKE